MDQFWPDLQLPKAKIKKPWATAECDKIPKMVKIICFYVQNEIKTINDPIISTVTFLEVLKHVSK